VRLRRTTIAFGGQQEVDGVPLLMNRAMPIPVLAANLDVRLVQSPAFADRTDATFALPFTKGFLQHRNQLDDPAVNRGMNDKQAALLHHLFEIAQTQRVGDIPRHAQQHDVQWKSQPLDHASRIAHKQRQVRHQSPDRCLTRQADQRTTSIASLTLTLTLARQNPSSS
jgi:hypothetical protein